MKRAGEQMDCLFYLPSFAGGGAERNSVLLANEFHRRGLRVGFIVDRRRGPNDALLCDGVAIAELQGGGHLADVFRLRRALQRLRPSVVYAQVGLSPIKYLLAAAMSSQSIRSVIVYHGIYDRTWRLGARLSYWLAPLVSRMFDSVVAVSQGLRAHLVDRFRIPRAANVIHNPVDCHWVASMSQGDSRDVPARPYLVAVGRLVHQKDFSTLVRGFARITASVPQDLVILGDGPLRAALTKEIEDLGIADRVLMPGYVANPFPILRGADALVMSSAHEAFGNVLVEAMALGLRVIATDCPGGPREILADGEYGVLCRVGDPQSLADAILEALSMPHDPERQRQRASEFAVDRIATQYLEIAALEPMT